MNHGPQRADEGLFDVDTQDEEPEDLGPTGRPLPDLPWRRPQAGVIPGQGCNDAGHPLQPQPFGWRPEKTALVVAKPHRGLPRFRFAPGLQSFPGPRGGDL